MGQALAQAAVHTVENLWMRRTAGRRAALDERRRELAAPFSLGRSRRRGVIVVHGFTGTPFEMRLLGEALARADEDDGFAVEGPCLAGHGVEADRGRGPTLAETRWPDWLTSVQIARARLEARLDPGAPIALVGLSMGALLVLELARRAARGEERPVAAIAALATALHLQPSAERIADRIAPLLAARPALGAFTLPKIAGSDIGDDELRRENEIAQGQGGMAFAPLLSLVELGRHVAAGLHEVRAPALLMHGRHDHTIPFICMDEIAARLAGPVETVALDHSCHVVTLDRERETVFAAVAAHLRKTLQ